MLVASLDRVLAFHQELAALSAAGLPIAPDLGGSHREIVSRLDRINASLSLRTQLGQPIEQAIAEDANLPPRYRDRLLVWLRCDRPSIVMNSISRPITTSLAIRHEINIVLIQLIVITVLTYLAFIVLCLWINPQIEAIYAQLERSPDWISIWLSILRDWLPVWAIGLPVLLGGLLLRWRSRLDEDKWARLLGFADYLAALRYANLSHHLAELLEDGLSLAESLPLAISLSDGPGSVPVSRNFDGDEDPRASALPTEALPPETLPPETLPPILCWALQESAHGESVVTALRFSAEAYRKLAEHLRRRWLRWIPVLFSTLLAGALVMVYGLSVFLPVIWLLRDLSISGS